MRHRVSRRKLGRPTDQRENLLRSLVTSLIIHEKLVTTVTRAKEARILCEKVITYVNSNVRQPQEIFNNIPNGKCSKVEKLNVKNENSNF